VLLFLWNVDEFRLRADIAEGFEITASWMESHRESMYSLGVSDIFG
jgi:hypothetical protein